MSEQHGVPPDVDARLHELERMVRDAKAVPLSASIMLNKADVESVVDELREALPDELTQARWVIKERDEILERAREDSERLVADARAESERLVSDQEVVQNAEANADQVLAEAREHARRIRLEAEDYVDAKLANFEVVLTRTLGAVERGRAKLRGQFATDQLNEDELVAELNDEFNQD